MTDPNEIKNQVGPALIIKKPGWELKQDWETVLKREEGCTCVMGAYTCPQCMERIEGMLNPDGGSERIRQLLIRGYAHIARADSDLAAEIRKELWGDCPERALASPQVPA